jgi:uncharacterized membrane protein
MKKKEVQFSNNYSSHTIKAILSIFVFALTYLFILAVCLFLTFVFIILGIQLIDLNPTFITFFFGIGIASMGVFVLIFMLKFLFKSYCKLPQKQYALKLDKKPLILTRKK